MITSKFADYFKYYAEKVPEGDIEELLDYNLKECLKSLVMVSEEKSLYAYAEGKWTIREIVQHLIDTERIFCYRALSIARGEEQELLGYNHDVYAKTALANSRTLRSLLEEFKNLRRSTIDLYSSLTKETLQNIGVANGLEISTEQIFIISIGHCIHHIEIIEQKYLND